MGDLNKFINLYIEFDLLRLIYGNRLIQSYCTGITQELNAEKA